MTGKQTFVGAGGLALVAADFWTSPDRGTVSGGIFNPGGNVTQAHTVLKKLFGELAFVIVATVLAGLGDSWGSAMAAVVVGLFILFAINHYGGGVSSSSTSTTSAPSTGNVRGAAA
jgi:hypothetical protein